MDEHEVASLTAGRVREAAAFLARQGFTVGGLRSPALTLALCEGAAAGSAGVHILVALDREGAVQGAVVAVRHPRRFWASFLIRRPLTAAKLLSARLGGRLARMGLRPPPSGAPPANAGGPPREAKAGGMPMADEARRWNRSTPAAARVLLIAVAPEARKHGLAASLYRGLFDHLARAGVRELLAKVSAENEASLALHRRTGWWLHPAASERLCVRCLDGGAHHEVRSHRLGRP